MTTCLARYRDSYCLAAREFANDKSGAVAVLFGLMSVALLLVIGVSIDMARWLHARSITISAVDSAVLAGARKLQINGRDVDAATKLAQNYYEANVASRGSLSEDTIRFKVEEGGTAVTADGGALIGTTFLKLAGITKLPLLKLSGSEFSKAVLAANGNSEFSVEVALMLDITGSMCNSGLASCSGGEKIDAMKEAAKDLVNVVVWDNQGSHTSKVALVPFSAGVNLGGLGTDIIAPGPMSKKLTNADGRRAWWKRASACAAERAGPNAYSDSAPVLSEKLTAIYSLDGLCQPGSQNTVVPLSSDKHLLTAKIDALSAAGSTAGHLGTAWSWYVLSPEWSNVLPPGSRPLSYSLISQVSSSGRPLLQKVAVLMTDGEFNTQYCETGQRDKSANVGRNEKGDCEPVNGTSNEQTRALCAAMKAKGITIYTVGFQLQSGGEAEQTMSLCASSKDHTFVANNAQELKQSFRNIALTISDLHLSK